MTAAAVVLAAGTGTRMERDRPKAFLTAGGTSLLTLAVEAAAACPGVSCVVVAVPAGWEQRARSLLPVSGTVVVVTGGATRQESVRVALDEVPSDADVALVHDAARALATPELFGAVLDAVRGGADGAVPVVPVADTVKRVRDGWIEATESRDELALAQTPQGFALAALREAHRRGAEEGLEFTDDAALMEWAGHRVRAVPGERDNFKVTTPEDLPRVEHVLAARGAGAGTRRERAGG
ncbi:MAG TPA: 2-C-methyl-D-erythritol 4-phosphate cytidylyltransferase [Actinomycetota bacterium]|nr:2-C-methyl-D-erythritol 4-phosphate cytidylyltransferase [Actinomycetota bacterium]